jgi:glutaredoxin
VAEGFALVRLVTLYTRKGCHLCDHVHALLRDAGTRAAFRLELRDIDSNPEWRQRYDWEVPVVAIDGEDVFRHAIDVDAFLKRVSASS